MSSAILFLAIIAIWACALVPRWLRRSHEANSEPEVHDEQMEATYYAEPPERAAEYGADMDPSPISYEAEDGSAAYSDPPAWSDSPVRSEPSAWSDSPARPDTPAPSDSPARSDLPARPGSAAHRDAYRSNRYGPVGPPAPAIASARVLQARRRMLTMLVALAVAAVGCVITGLTRWWTAVPPVGMLSVYLLLLREAARADVEASRHAEAYARSEAARAARHRSWEAQAQARAAQAPEPAAEIINISDRDAEPGDQPYDQYADAEVRAVGD